VRADFARDGYLAQIARRQFIVLVHHPLINAVILVVNVVGVAVVIGIRSGRRDGGLATSVVDVPIIHAIDDKANGTITKCKIRSAGMKAAKPFTTERRSHRALAQRIGRLIEARLVVTRDHREIQLIDSGPINSRAGRYGSECVLRADPATGMAILRIPLADNGCIAGAVRDIGHADVAVTIKDAGVRGIARDAAVPHDTKKIAESLRTSAVRLKR